MDVIINEHSKTEKSIPTPIKPINNIHNNIISGIRSFVEDKKPLSTAIKNEIK